MGSPEENTHFVGPYFDSYPNRGRPQNGGGGFALVVPLTSTATESTLPPSTIILVGSPWQVPCQGRVPSGVSLPPEPACSTYETRRYQR